MQLISLSNTQPESAVVAEKKNLRMGTRQSPLLLMRSTEHRSKGHFAWVLPQATHSKLPFKRKNCLAFNGKSIQPSIC